MCGRRSTPSDLARACMRAMLAARRVRSRTRAGVLRSVSFMEGGVVLAAPPYHRPDRLLMAAPPLVLTEGAARIASGAAARLAQIGWIERCEAMPTFHDPGAVPSEA